MNSQRGVQTSIFSTVSGNKWENYKLATNSNQFLNSTFFPRRGYATVTVKPDLSSIDSASDGILGPVPEVGSFVEKGDVISRLETDKVHVDILAPESGKITQVFKQEGDVVSENDNIVEIDTSAKGEKKAAAPKEESKPQAKESKPEVKESKPAAEKKAPESKPVQSATVSETPKSAPAPGRETRERMSKLRQTIAQRLKASQDTAAMLTTFQECDMHNLIEMRNEYKDLFAQRHGVRLGFMSAFVKASAAALMQERSINAFIDGDEIVYRDYVDISVAVATPTGLLTPVVRDCDKMSFAEIEKEIASLADKAKNKKITMQDLQGGTFTISNGGVYGSLMGTPILNPPQSAILGMHGTNKRPVVIGDQIVIRPMMYLV